jgi:hypothetical protein
MLTTLIAGLALALALGATVPTAAPAHAGATTATDGSTDFYGSGPPG